MFFLKNGHPGLVFFYFSYLKTIYRIKTVDFSGNGTRIDGVEDEHADDHHARYMFGYQWSEGIMWKDLETG